MNKLDGQADGLRLAVLVELHLKPHLAVRVAFEDAAKPLAAVDQLLQLDLDLVAGPVLEIRRADEDAVDAGRGHFEIIAVLDGIVCVEQRRKPAADIRAILHNDGPARLIHHDLDRGAVALRHDHAHKPEAHVFQHGFHKRGNPGRGAGFTQKALRGRFGRACLLPI